MDFDKRSATSRVALVTGAAGSIGSSVVRRLSADGWKVAGIDLKENSAELPLHVDVTDRPAMMAAAAQVAGIGKEDVSAFLCKSNTNTFANSTATTGYDGNPVF
ncbi:hypothetical protein ES708_22681 [subsurface metagenome]